MFKRTLFMILTMFASCGFAGELVRDATIVEVFSNAGLHADNFGVRVQGGTGACANTLIFFPKAKALTGATSPKSVSIETYNQWFSLASMALATGMKVRIHNYDDDNCYFAEMIAVSK